MTSENQSERLRHSDNLTQVGRLTSEIRRSSSPDEIIQRSDRIVRHLAESYLLSESFGTVDYHADTRFQRSDVMAAIRQKVDQGILPPEFVDYVVLALSVQRARQLPDSNIKARILDDIVKKSDQMHRLARLPQLVQKFESIRQLAAIEHAEIANAKVVQLDRKTVEVDAVTLLANGRYIDWTKLVNPAAGETFSSMNENFLQRTLVKSAQVMISSRGGALSKLPPSHVENLIKARGMLAEDIAPLRGLEDDSFYKEGQKAILIINHILQKNRQSTFDGVPVSYVEPLLSAPNSEVFNDLAQLFNEVDQQLLADVSELAVRLSRKETLNPAEQEKINSLLIQFQHVLNRNSSLLREFDDANSDVLAADTRTNARSFINVVRNYVEWLSFLKSKTDIVEAERAVPMTEAERLKRKWEVIEQFRPEDDAGVARHQEFYTEQARKLPPAEAIQWLVKEGRRVLNEFGFEASKTDETIEARRMLVGFTNALGGLMKERGLEKLSYWKQYFEQRQRLTDMDIKYAQGRSMTCELDELQKEIGTLRFSPKTFDFFFLDPSIVAPENELGVKEERYEHWKVMESALKISMDLLLDRKSRFFGSKFVEDENAGARFTEAVKARLVALPQFARENPDVIEEVVGISYQIGCVLGLRFKTFAYTYAEGTSPVGEIGDRLKYINEVDPVSQQLYKGYKYPTYLPPFEILRLPKEWFEIREGKPGDRPGATGAPGYRWTPEDKRNNTDAYISAKQKRRRLQNIKDSIHGTQLAVDSVAPVRYPMEMHLEGPHRLLRSTYPSAWDYVIHRAAERRALPSPSFQTWSKGRENFMTFEHAIYEPFDSGAGKSNEDYREYLVGQMESMLNSKISGLKTNMLIDWTEIGHLTLLYIDRMFRAYVQKDRGLYGTLRLQNRIVELIDNSVGLESAGKMWLEDPFHHTGDALVYGNPNIPKNKQILIGDFLKREIAIRGGEAERNAERRMPFGKRWIEKARLAMFCLRYKEFRKSIRVLGQTSTEKNKSPDAPH